MEKANLSVKDDKSVLKSEVKLPVGRFDESRIH